MPKFFISFNSVDRPDVRYFVNKLKEALPRHVEIFYDEELRPSERWWDVILEQIATADAVLCVLTTEFFDSAFCRAEYLEAVRLNVPVVPLLWRDIDIPGEFAAVQYVKMSGWVASGNDIPGRLTRHLVEYLTNPRSPVRGGTPTPNPDHVLPPDWDWSGARPRGWKHTRPTAEEHDPTNPTQPHPFIAGPAILPIPFAWMKVDAGKVFLEAGGYIRENNKRFPVKPFYIGRYPITNAQFRVFVQHPHGYQEPRWWDFSESARAWRRDHHQPFPAEFDGDNLPRTQVTWYEALAFCTWLSDQTGKRISLPTEQQWQLAAQGPQGHEYPWGDMAPNHTLANYDWAHPTPTPVGEYPDGASPYGVEDLAGNVWEWCSTSWVDGDSLIGDHPRVVRGGAYSFKAEGLRAAGRYSNSPSHANLALGFRCVMAV